MEKNVYKKIKNCETNIMYSMLNHSNRGLKDYILQMVSDMYDEKEPWIVIAFDLNIIFGEPI